VSVSKNGNHRDVVTTSRLTKVGGGGGNASSQCSLVKKGGEAFH